MIKYHGTVTAKRVTKTGHTMLQLDNKDEVVLLGTDPAVKQEIEVYDNIMFTKTPGPTFVSFLPRGERKPQQAKFLKDGITVITVQMSDRTLNMIRRRKDEAARMAPPVSKKDARIAAAKLVGVMSLLVTEDME